MPKQLVKLTEPLNGWPSIHPYPRIVQFLASCGHGNDMRRLDEMNALEEMELFYIPIGQ